MGGLIDKELLSRFLGHVSGLLAGKADRSELPSAATASAAGLAKPDGSTILAAADGTLTAACAWEDIHLSGSTGTVTLSKPVDQFDLVMILYRARGDLSGESPLSSVVFEPGQAPQVALDAAFYYAGSGQNIDSRLVYASGNRIYDYKTGWQGRGWVGEGKTVSAASKSGAVVITGVFGCCIKG